jgi:hypothetical protein
LLAVTVASRKHRPHLPSKLQEAGPVAGAPRGGDSVKSSDDSVKLPEPKVKEAPQLRSAGSVRRGGSGEDSSNFCNSPSGHLPLGGE